MFRNIKKPKKNIMSDLVWVQLQIIKNAVRNRRTAGWKVREHARQHSLESD